MTESLQRAQREHVRATALFESAILASDESAWHRAGQGRTWTLAEETAHVLLAYDFGARAAEGTMSMRVTRPAWMSAVTRNVLLPLLLKRGAFPSGGVSPLELDPREQHVMTTHVVNRESARAMLQQLADRVERAFVHAASSAPKRRIVHAYFGGVGLIPGWRLLSAHTRHHAGRMSNASTTRASGR